MTAGPRLSRLLAAFSPTSPQPSLLSFSKIPSEHFLHFRKLSPRQERLLIRPLFFIQRKVLLNGAHAIGLSRFT